MSSLLYALAERANEGIRQRRYSKTLLLSCLQVAASFHNSFSQNDAQDIFLQRFVDALLKGLDEKVLIWLSKRELPLDLPLSWKNYLSQQSASPLSSPAWIRRLFQRKESSKSRSLFLLQASMNIKYNAHRSCL